jgi:hypothetical protein
LITLKYGLGLILVSGLALVAGCSSSDVGGIPLPSGPAGGAVGSGGRTTTGTGGSGGRFGTGGSSFGSGGATTGTGGVVGTAGSANPPACPVAPPSSGDNCTPNPAGGMQLVCNYATETCTCRRNSMTFNCQNTTMNGAGGTGSN